MVKENFEKFQLDQIYLIEVYVERLEYKGYVQCVNPGTLVFKKILNIHHLEYPKTPLNMDNYIMVNTVSDLYKYSFTEVSRRESAKFLV